MITVLGSINMDLIATTDRLPKPGETVAGTSFSTAAGGKGANQALAAKRAGASVRMAGAVGDDPFATEALILLTNAGTDLSQVRIAPEPTGTAHILVDRSGENVIVIVAGANAVVDETAARKAVDQMSRGDILMLQLEIPPESVEAALVAAKAKGVTSVINIAPLTPEAARLARMADIVIANETEFELLAGQSDMNPKEREAAMTRIHAETAQTLIVTLGADGVVAIRKTLITRTKGLVIEPVDTVGAGDTFCGYLAAGLDAGLAFEDALRRAAVAGSLACTKPGAQPSIPMVSAVEKHL